MGKKLWAIDIFFYVKHELIFHYQGNLYRVVCLSFAQLLRHSAPVQHNFRRLLGLTARLAGD